MSKKSSNTAVQDLLIEEIRPGKFQPRVVFDQDAIQELALSIREEGLLQPITVRPIADEEDPECKYEIIAGERRWRAFQLNKSKTIPAIVRDLDDKQTAIASLTENLQRESLTAIEEARGYKKLIEELKMKQQEIADRVGKSRPTIANMLRLLTLNKDVIHLVESGQIDACQARPLVVLPKEQQLEAAEQVITKGLNTRQAELLAKRLVERNARADNGEEEEGSDNIDDTLERAEEIQEDLQEAFGENVKVKVAFSASGLARITFSASEEVLEDLLELLKAGTDNE